MQKKRAKTSNDVKEDEVQNILKQYESDRKQLVQLRAEEQKKREDELALKLASRRKATTSSASKENDVSLHPLLFILYFNF